MVRKHITPAMSSHWGGAANPGYFLPKDAVPSKGHFKFAAVTDLDQLSRMPGDKPKFRSVLLPGTLTHQTSGKYLYDLQFETPRTLVTKHNEAGRGAEFSELTLYQNRLLTFDDRTGDVFEILNKDQDESFVVPRFIITEGDGETDKGMKWEWSTVKRGDLYLGSMGKEYTRPDGSIENVNNLWIAVLNARGEVRREDWTSQYNAVRKALAATSPGYIIVEAVNWSDVLKKWVFLPRRVSHDAYDEVKDEKKGSNKVVLLDEDFSNAKVVDIDLESMDPLKGFSTFAFVPGTGDQHAIVIRSVEEDCVGGDEMVCKQRSYFLVVDVMSGKQLSKEVKYTEDLKFEGIEFVDIFTKP